MDSRKRPLPKIRPYRLDQNYATPAPAAKAPPRIILPTSLERTTTSSAKEDSSVPHRVTPQSRLLSGSQNLPHRSKPGELDCSGRTPSTVFNIQGLWPGARRFFDHSSPTWATKSYYTAIILCLVFYVFLLRWPVAFVRSPSVRTVLDGAESELSTQLTPFSQSLQVASSHLAQWVELKDEGERVHQLENRVGAYQSQQRELMNRYRRLYSTTMPKARSSGSCRLMIHELLEINTTTGLLKLQHTSINLTLKGVMEDFRVRSNVAYDSNAAWHKAMYESYASIRNTKSSFDLEPYTSSQQVVLGIIEQLTLQCGFNATKHFVAWSPEQMRNKKVVNNLLPRMDNNVKLLLGRS